MIKYKSCSGCKALYCVAGTYFCDLDFGIETKGNEVTPTERCPKPETDWAFVLAFNEIYHPDSYALIRNTIFGTDPDSKK